jgi:XXXCH domain-containing protein
MKTPKRKLKTKFKIVELEAYFRTIADALEGKTDLEDKNLIGLFDNFSQATIRMKRKAKKISLDIKVDAEPLSSGETKDAAVPGPAATPATETLPDAAPPEPQAPETSPKPKKLKYKDLKKRMKKSFKAIKESVSDSRLPERSDLVSFLNDSEQMVSYPGYGDAYYSEYQKACQALEDAAGRLDFATFKHQLEAVNKLQKECHNRYK